MWDLFLSYISWCLVLFSSLLWLFLSLVSTLGAIQKIVFSLYLALSLVVLFFILLFGICFDTFAFLFLIII